MSPRSTKKPKPKPKPKAKRKFDLRLTVDTEGEQASSKKWTWKGVVIAVLSGALITPAMALMGYGAWALLHSTLDSALPTKVETEGEFRWHVNIYGPGKSDRLDAKTPNDVVRYRFIDIEPKVAKLDSVPLPRPKPREIAARDAPIDTYPDRAIGPRIRNKCDDETYKSLPLVINPCLQQPLNIKPPVANLAR
jgi:hypothetical protein